MTRTRVPQIPNVYRPIDIMRSPVRGPRHANQATTQLKTKLTMKMTANESQNPSPKMGPSAPVASVAGLYAFVLASQDGT
jgi:hypothetical protein